VYTGFLAFAGTELVNNARAAAYATALGVTTVMCAPCPTIPRAEYDTPYTSPDNDDAPWWDAGEPDSKDFAGFLGLSVTGLSKTTGGRIVVPLATDGAALHPVRRTHKEIQVQVLALARTEAALSYGFSWLSAALRGQICASGCGGDTLCFFTACPPCDPPPTDGSADTCGDPYWRTMLNVGLLSMDEPTDVKQIPGGWLARITYTLAAGNPFIYREPILMATGPQPAQQLPDYTDPGLPLDCFETADCLHDVDTCPAPPAPVLPPLPVDACFPTGAFNASRLILTLAEGQVPIWAEKVPLILIKAGALTLRRLTIRWYGNPTGRDCTVGLDPCSACAEVNIAFIPAGSTLTIDGRIESAYVDCAGGPGLATAEPQLYGRGGSPFVWPAFSCADAQCLEIICESDSLADDASLEVYYVVREDAA
jgi:hypothetical protein